MSDVKWQNPPTRNTGPGASKFDEAAQALRERPNTWAIISGDSGSSPQNFGRNRRPVAFQDPAFEFTARARDDGKCDIYARFVEPEVSA